MVAGALASLGGRAAIVDVDLPGTLDAVQADPALLERAVANVVENAIRYSPVDGRVRVEAGSFAGHADLRVIDRGPGIHPEDRDRVFQPFQRLGDRGGAGVGLGMAVAAASPRPWAAPSRWRTRPGEGRR